MKEFKLSGFADEGGNTAEEQIQILKTNGVHYVEVRKIDGKNILELDDGELKILRKKFDGAGIKVSAIGSPIGKTQITEDFSLTRASFEMALAAAVILDALYIRAFSFYTPKEDDPMKWADEVIFRLQELVKTAAQKGKQYALENESGIFTDIPSRCVYALDRVKGLSLAFDPGNFIFNDADPLEAWKLLKNKVAYFHIKDASRSLKYFVPAGEGDGSIARILKEAYSGGFDGFLSVEPHLKKYLENQPDTVRFTAAVNGLKKVLNSTFNAGLKMA